MREMLAKATPLNLMLSMCYQFRINEDSYWQLFHHNRNNKSSQSNAHQRRITNVHNLFNVDLKTFIILTVVLSKEFTTFSLADTAIFQCLHWVEASHFIAFPCILSLRMCWIEMFCVQARTPSMPCREMYCVFSCTPGCYGSRHWRLERWWLSRLVDDRYPRWHRLWLCNSGVQVFLHRKSVLCQPWEPQPPWRHISCELGRMNKSSLFYCRILETWVSSGTLHCFVADSIKGVQLLQNVYRLFFGFCFWQICISHSRSEREFLFLSCALSVAS